jgi:hypothetical protein
MARARSLDLVRNPSVSLRALPHQILPVGTPGPASSCPPIGYRDGVCVRLPAEAPVGCRVQVTVGGAEIRSGTVRWVKPQEGAWFSHGVGFDTPPGRRGMVSPQVHRFRRRQRVRRTLFWFVALGVIALTAAGLVWVMEGLRNYQPRYYEPKDIEREIHETQRRLDNAKPPPSR